MPKIVLLKIENGENGDDSGRPRGKKETKKKKQTSFLLKIENGENDDDSGNLRR
jgi:hypothetical protein